MVSYSHHDITVKFDGASCTINVVMTNGSAYTYVDVRFGKVVRDIICAKPSVDQYLVMYKNVLTYVLINQ